MTDRLNPEAFLAAKDAGREAFQANKDWHDITTAMLSAYDKSLALPAPRTVTTVEELEALPVGVVVIDPYAAVCVRQYDMDFWGDWKRVTTAVAGGAHNHKPYLPATVLHVPTEGGGESTIP